MKEMKMSDVFELPVHSGMKAATKASAIYDARGTFGILNDQAMRHVAHAINTHDRLQQENAELREILQKTATAIYSHNNEMVGMHTVMNCANESIKLLNKND